MEPSDKLDAWSKYAAISRDWVRVMDAKAGFISALNLGLIATLWSRWALVQECTTLFVKIAGGVTTLLALISTFLALWAVLPRESLSRVFGKGSDWSPTYHPVSFYGYVARSFQSRDFEKFLGTVNGMDETALANEALEQHFVISHTLAIKSKYVERAGYALMLAFVGMVLTLIPRLIT